MDVNKVIIIDMRYEIVISICMIKTILKLVSVLVFYERSSLHAWSCFTFARQASMASNFQDFVHRRYNIP